MKNSEKDTIRDIIGYKLQNLEHKDILEWENLFNSYNYNIDFYSFITDILISYFEKIKKDNKFIKGLLEDDYILNSLDNGLDKIILHKSVNDVMKVYLGDLEIDNYNIVKFGVIGFIMINI